MGLTVFLVEISSDSAEGEGGTWAGATENLSHAWTPIYVRIPGESPGNAALITRGAQKFDYELAERASMREFLEKSDQSGSTSPLFQQAVSDVTIATSKTLLPAPFDVVASPEVMEDKAPTVELNMFQDFLARLPLILGDTAKSDEEIRQALGLEKSQIKVWLIAATKQGLLEKRKNPVRYALPRQRGLC